VISRREERRHIAIVSDTRTPEVTGVTLTLARLAACLRVRGDAVSIVYPDRPALDPGGPQAGRRGPGVVLASPRSVG